MFGRRREADPAQLEAQLAALEQRILARVEGVESLLQERLKGIESRLDDEPADRTRLLLNTVADEVRADLTGLLDDAGRLRKAADDARARSGELDEAANALVARLSGQGPHPWRKKARLNKVYQSESLAYISLYFTGGRQDKVSILIGDEDPPTKSWCVLNARNGLNPYAGAVVRPGEYWMARSDVGEGSGVACVYTPFY